MSRSSIALARRAALLALATCAAAGAGHLAAPPPYVPLFRAGTALLVAALVRRPPREWSAYLAAGSAGTAAAHLAVGAAPAPALTDALLVVVAAVAAAVPLVMLLGSAPRLRSLRSAAVYLFTAALAAPILAASVGAGIAAARGAAAFAPAWRLLVLGEAAAALTLTPLLLAAGRDTFDAIRRAGVRRHVEAALLAAGLVVSGAVAFASAPPAAPPLVFLPLPFLLWAAVRFQVAGAAAAMLAVTLAATVGGAADAEALALALSVPLICLAALVGERADAEAALRRAETKLRMLFESNVLPIAFWSADGRITEANDAYLRLVQYTRRELAAGEVRRDRLTPSDQCHLDQRALEEVCRTGVCTPYGKEYLLRDGRRVPVLIAAGRISGGGDHGVSFAVDMTALRRTEAALRASEARYRHLLESAAVALWEEDFSAVRALVDSLPARGITDLRAHTAAHPAFVRRALRKVRVVGVNEAAVRLFGARDKAELVAAGEQLFTEETLGAFADALVAMAEERPAFEAYTTARTLEGRRVELLVAARFPDWESGAQSVLVSAVDLTDRRRAEVERAARAELRTLIDLAPIGIAWADDARCNRIVGNRALNRIFGAGPGANLSPTAPGSERTYRVFKEGRELETHELPLHCAAASGITIEGFESDMVRDDGTTVHLLTSAAPVLDEAGRVRGAIGAVVDVTAHRVAARRLRAAEARLISTLDALSAHIAILDETGTIVAVNGAWREFAVANGFTGTSHGVGWNYLEVCRAATGDAVAEARAAGDGIRAVMEGAPTHVRLEYPCPGPAGPRWFQLRATRFIEDGLVRVVVAHENVTEIKLAERALRTLTGRLLRARDEERRRVARELHDGAAQLLVGVSIGLERLRPFAERLEETPRRVVGEAAELNGRALKEIRTLSYLLHPPELEALGLASALRWYVEGFAERSGIDVEFAGPGDWERLPSGTETALFRIVQEALANVHRHSGSATARVELCRVDGQVELRVRDAGRGMPAEPAQAGGSQGRSLGVGIGGMRERVRLLGGRLEIVSGRDGTTVSATVPVAWGERTERAEESLG